VMPLGVFIPYLNYLLIQFESNQYMHSIMSLFVCTCMRLCVIYVHMFVRMCVLIVVKIMHARIQT
jgi:hypothetical protein